MASAKAQMFTTAVFDTLSSWSVLRIATQHGFGGINAKEKEEWLYESVVKIFNDNGLVYPDELEDFISEVLFNEFDTIIEDGSLKEMCETLCKYYKLCDERRFEEVTDAVKAMISKNADIAPVTLHDDDGDDADDDIGGQISNLSNCENKVVAEPFMEIDEDQQREIDEGWELVQRSKRK